MLLRVYFGVENVLVWFGALTNSFATEPPRTTLTIEPELGRKLLDLRKLYEKVTALGGYDKVTEEKGKILDVKYPMAMETEERGVDN